MQRAASEAKAAPKIPCGKIRHGCDKSYNLLKQQYRAGCPLAKTAETAFLHWWRIFYHGFYGFTDIRGRGWGGELGAGVFYHKGMKVA